MPGKIIPPKISVCADLPQLSRQAAMYWSHIAEQSVADRGQFAVALAGGSTPQQLYRLLATPAYAQLPWQHTHIFFGDERSVAADHQDSNFRMADESLLAKVPIPNAQIHCLRGTLADLRHSAHEYAQLLRKSMRLNVQNLPQFDLVLLGMGDDGHTASLFPNTCILRENRRLVAANYVPQLNTWRISLTYPTINAARHIAILVAGQSKAQRIKEIFAAQLVPHPIQRIQAAGETHWFLDKAAAQASSLA